MICGCIFSCNTKGGQWENDSPSWPLKIQKIKQERTTVEFLFCYLSFFLFFFFTSLTISINRILTVLGAPETSGGLVQSLIFFGLFIFCLLLTLKQEAAVLANLSQLGSGTAPGTKRGPAALIGTVLWSQIHV